jgi:hypothetical protein
MTFFSIFETKDQFGRKTHRNRKVWSSLANYDHVVIFSFENAD